MIRAGYERVLKPLLKRLRQVEALNAPLTDTIRWSLGRVGRQAPPSLEVLFRAGDFDLDLPLGGRVRIHATGDDSLATKLFWWGWRAHEPETLSLFQALARRSTTVVDVGAHIGLFTLIAAVNVRAGGRVFAFEPVPQSFQRLTENVQLNRLDNTKLIDAAAGTEASEMDFRFVAGVERPLIGGLARRFADDAKMLTMKVRVLTLDQVIGDRPVDLMKLDTETTEPDVLAGARVILQRDRPVIITEVWGEPEGQALTEVLKPLGYRFFALEREGPVPTDIVRGGAQSLNCLATTSSAEDVYALSRAAQSESRS